MDSNLVRFLVATLATVIAGLPASSTRGQTETPVSPLTLPERQLAFELAGEVIAAKKLDRGHRVVATDAYLLADKPRGKKPRSRRAHVLHYRYDGVTLLSTVDLKTGKLVAVEESTIPAPVAEEEMKRAIQLALSDAKVVAGLGKHLKKIEPEILVLRAPPGDPLASRRVVRMMFRRGRDYLTWPIAIVDLTAGTVQLEKEKPPSGPGHSKKPTRPGASPSVPKNSQVLKPTVFPTALPTLKDHDQLIIDLREEIENLELDDDVDWDALINNSSCCPRHTRAADGQEVIQEFPAGGEMRTAWKVHFAHAPRLGLYITAAWFKTSPDAGWMLVLRDARVSNIFVPYHSGSPRFYDLSNRVLDAGLLPVTDGDLGCCGQRADNFVVKEVRDRGILWKDDNVTRRGHELLLWGTVDAANYNYIIQYGFRDDGTITFRLGATARNLPGQEMEAHMHDALWRVDVDLDGADHDSALHTRHLELPEHEFANDFAEPFRSDHEGGIQWNPLDFTGIRVVDTQRTNSHGEPISYDLMPWRWGRPVHRESWSHADLWVTRHDASQLAYTLLWSYADDEASVTDTDIVLWHMSGVHHLPRREDGGRDEGFWRGVAPVMWSGFNLRPRNLFDGTPLFD